MRTLDFLFPDLARCVGCGDLSGADDEFLCESCKAALQKLREPPKNPCPRCGAPLRSIGGCDCCKRLADGGIRRYAYALPYEPPVPGLLHAYKYDCARVLLALLSEIFTEAAKRSGILSLADMIVPVPLSRRRLSERGFNQSLLLADALSKASGIPCSEPLSRVRATKAQAGQSSDFRRANLRGAFASEPCVLGRRILLTDDVRTTGATLAECARTLLAAGAAEVYAVTFAASVPSIHQK